MKYERKPMNHPKAFTLIELLVVIAIIGLLATIVGVNVNSARQKGNTAKSVQFANTIYHSIGDNCVAYYDFNDTADGTLKDISGNGNTGTIHGAVSTTSLTYSGGNLGNALYFDGTDDYVDIPEAFDNLSDATLEMWFSYLDKGLGTYAVLFGNYKNNSNRINPFIYNNQYLYSEMFYNGTQYIIKSNSPISSGWHHAAFLFGADGMKMFLDGIQQNSTNNATSSFVDVGPSVQTQIGAHAVISNPWKGYIDEVRIYSTALSSAEIEQHYAEGLLKHLLVQD